MAAIPVVLNGVWTTDTGTTIGVFNGTMAHAGLGIGGGPIEGPVDPGYGKPTPPDMIWGGRPGPGGGGSWVPGQPIDPHPEHPIVLPPDPPTEPPTEPPTNPPSPQWVWGFNPTVKAWVRVYVPEQGVQPGPKV